MINYRWVQQKTYIPYLVCCIAALVFFVYTFRDMRQQQQQEQSISHSVAVPNVKASFLLAGRTQFYGQAGAPYTLVEFGDHECPPCRLIQHTIVETLKKYNRQIKLDFRELPLSSIHPQAEAAALAAESARPMGKFWIVHDRLLSADLSKDDAISGTLASVHVRLNTKIAQRQLLADENIEKQLRINATPTFFLCRPDGVVLRLPNIKSLESSF